MREQESICIDRGLTQCFELCRFTLVRARQVNGHFFRTQPIRNTRVATHTSWIPYDTLLLTEGKL